VILSLLGSYIDGQRYNNPELVELVKQMVKWFPDYTEDIIIQTYDIVKNIPVLRDASEIAKSNVMEIGKKLIRQWTAIPELIMVNTTRK
jgi:hypothetical protein